MVRKRAPAQKGLSPSKTAGNTSAGRKRKHSVQPEEEYTEEEMEVKNKQQKTDMINGNIDDPVIKPDEEETHDVAFKEEELETTVLDQKYDELPDLNTLAKEISEKTQTYWDAVSSDYSDFANWTCLLQTVTETEDNIEAARGAYNCFLRYYPYCYGYWKKFADIEKKNGNLEEAKEVFQRGVEAIPVSVDLWVHYLNFSIHQWKGKSGGQNEVRQLFKEAIGTAGMEFKSNKLWDAYIDWEKALGNLKHVTEIYDRLITTPTQQYLKNWQKFKDHLQKYSLLEVLPTEEYSRLMQKVDAIPPGMTNDSEDTVITAEPPGAEDGDNQEDSTADSTNEDSSKLNSLKRKVILDRESIFVETASEIKKRWKYEEAIKRPYFHVKPLEKTQLKNWKEYLDYEMREGSHKRICFLFERCLVACALYEEFWQKYIAYVESRDSHKARDVYSRACNIYLLKKYDINLSWATFEEKQKNYNLASKILENIDQNFPGMILITQRRVGLARRMGKLKDVASIYDKAIAKSEAIEDKIFYMIKYSHVLAKFCHKKSTARDILWEALELGKKHKRIYLQLFDLELNYGTVDNEYVERLFNAVERDMRLSDELRDSFAQRKVEFYAEYGDDIETILAVKSSYDTERKKRDRAKRLSSSSGDATSSHTKGDSFNAAGNIPLPQSKDTMPKDSYNYSQEAPWYNSSEGGNSYGAWSNYSQYQQQQQ